MFTMRTAAVLTTLVACLAATTNTVDGTSTLRAAPPTADTCTNTFQMAWKGDKSQSMERLEVDQYAYDESTGVVVVRRLTPEANIPPTSWDSGKEALIGFNATTGEKLWTSKPSDGVMAWQGGNYGLTRGVAADGRVAFAQRGTEANKPSLVLLSTLTGEQLGAAVPAPACTGGAYPAVKCTQVVFRTQDPSVLVTGQFNNGLMTLHVYSVAENPGKGPAFTHLWQTSGTSYLSPFIFSGPTGSSHLYVVSSSGGMERYNLHTGTKMGSSNLYSPTGNIGQISTVVISPDDRYIVAVPNTWQTEPAGPQLLIADSNCSAGAAVHQMPPNPKADSGGWLAWAPDGSLHLAAALRVYSMRLDEANGGAPTHVTSAALRTNADYELVAGLAAGPHGGFVVWGTNGLWQESASDASADSAAKVYRFESVVGNPIGSGVIAANGTLAIFAPPSDLESTLFALHLECLAPPSGGPGGHAGWIILGIVGSIALVGACICYARKNASAGGDGGYTRM